jgi:hypothetical protein
VNIVSHVGLLVEKHGSGMRSFNVRCTSYDPELSGRYKSSDFMLCCFFDIGRRWEAYEPPRAGTLVHIIGQLIGRYKMGDDGKPAVLITDFKVLVSSRNMHASASGGAGSPKRITPTKQRYRPKLSIGLTSLVTPGRNACASAATTSGGLVFDDNLQEALSSHVSGQLTKPSVPLSEDVENVSLTADEELLSARTVDSSAVSGTVGELDSTYSVNNHNPDILEIEASMTEGQRQRPKRMKSGKKGGRRWGSPDL